MGFQMHFWEPILFVALLSCVGLRAYLYKCPVLPQCDS